MLLFLSLAGCLAPTEEHATVPPSRASFEARCGAERWDVKTGGDADAMSVDMHPRPIALEQLISLPRPSSLPSRRVGLHERRVYQLTDVSLYKYKLESDRDYHLVLTDGDWTVIAEIPSPECVPPGSPFARGISRARMQFESRFAAGDRFQRAQATVTVIGVGFFDFFHDQTGMAPNAVELHPLLDLCFGVGCTPSPATPSGCGCAAGHSGAPHLWAVAVFALAWRARWREKALRDL